MELCDIAKKRMLEDRGALPKEEGDSIRKYKAKHEEHFLSGWLRDDTEGEAEEMESRSLLVLLKFGLQRLQSTGPRQNSNSQSFLPGQGSTTCC